jgi:ATP-dependent DNA helicase PIF1
MSEKIEFIATENIKAAWKLMADPKQNTLLTGNAGTGKSTLVKRFIKHYDGKVIVLAPTGIAAVNIGGQTIHSFFHFPARPISYNLVRFLDHRKPDDEMKIKIINACKYIIIDEISMVRADIMDQIKWFFDKNFPKSGPFAGKKLIMVGDLDQLPPVVSSEDERQMINKRYNSEFFFSAKCWDGYSDFKTFKLTEVFRQKDPAFIELLNNIKNKKVSPFDIDRLNALCVNEGKLDVTDGVMLCAVNADANEVNAEMISRLDGNLVRLHGVIQGDFNHKNCAVEPIIDLKIGCRIMTMRNSNDMFNKYFNGTIGTFIGMHNESILMELDDKTVVEVSKFIFESIEYNYDSGNDKIASKPTGTFIQYPVKVAYAITIHKSQGQTFEKIIVDLGDRGAFAHGQVYVALSRCKSMQGIILRRALQNRDLIYDKAILEFNKNLNA